MTTEIINSVSDIVLAFAAIGGLVFTVMVFGVLFAQMLDGLFED